ncbi:glycosyl transferase family 2 [Porphyromonas gingivicanis]|uniref:Glycosyl transferase family 2 n=1 Tax=Porphyromonas gingivicanis TaxID=266762 RepID=A0A0A2G2K8_9PORP|nr:glycosyltransferase family 2 protein [Porphyromonas gingivicanis]KGN97508.1 glycosyl transferase family 2 [Porphyromonas gingivicanis]
MNASPLLSIAILNWNGQALLERFLPSVVRYSHHRDVEVVVIDNGSTDTSCSFITSSYPQIRLIRLEKNYGFAEGYNKGIQEITTPYLCLLNNDVEVSEGWTEAPLSLLKENCHIAAVQPKIKSYSQPSMFEYAGAAGGFLDRLGYPFCKGRILECVEEDNQQYDTESPIFWASGAALFIRRADFIAVGGLDRLFFAHMEEIDLAWRLQRMGKKIVYTPLSSIYHQGGASLQQGSPQKIYLNFRNNLLMLYKNLPKNSFQKVFWQRCFLDCTASMVYLLQAKPQLSKAIFKAYRDFAKMKKLYSPASPSALCPYTPTLSSISIIWQYFIRGRKYFRELPL